MTSQDIDFNRDSWDRKLEAAIEKVEQRLEKRLHEELIKKDADYKAALAEHKQVLAEQKGHYQEVINKQDATIKKQAATIKKQDATIKKQDATIKKQDERIKRQDAQIEGLKEANEELYKEIRKSKGLISSSERNQGGRPPQNDQGHHGNDEGNGNGEAKDISNKESYDAACLAFRGRKKLQLQWEQSKGRTSEMSPLDWHLHQCSDLSLIPPAERQMDCPMAENEHIDHPTLKLSPEEKTQSFGQAKGLSTSVTKTRRKGFKVIKTIETIQYEVATQRGDESSMSLAAGMGKYGPIGWHVTWKGLANSLMLVSVYAVPMERVGRILGDSFFNACNISRWVRHMAWHFLPIYFHFFKDLSKAKVVQMDDTGLYVEEMSKTLHRGGLKADSEMNDEEWDEYISKLENKAEKGVPLLAEVVKKMGRVAPYRNSSKNKESYHLSCLSWQSTMEDGRSTVVFFRTHFGSCANLLSNALQERLAGNKNILYIISDSSTVNQLDPELKEMIKVLDQGCYHHARRYVKGFEEKDEELASYLLELFLRLDECEWEAFLAPITKEKIMEARDKAKEMWEEIKEVAEYVVNEKEHKKAKNQIWKRGTLVYKGCQYILNHYEEMTRYLDESFLKGVNTFIERALRPTKRIMDAIHVRKTEESQLALDIVRTMLSTAECAGLDFTDYLKLIFRATREELESSPELYTPYAVATQIGKNENG